MIIKTAAYILNEQRYLYTNQLTGEIEYTDEVKAAEQAMKIYAEQFIDLAAIIDKQSILELKKQII